MTRLVLGLERRVSCYFLFPFKHGGLSLKTLKFVRGYMTCNPSPGDVETNRYLDFLDQPV